ncbi:hypothetical protein PTKIN_Ptkin16aG0079300 [Pterospermum kingtungense]
MDYSEKEGQIKHESHDHPLAFVEDQTDQNKSVVCSGCREVVSGPYFSCVKCRYHLHKKCAEAPALISSHPFHRGHSPVLLRRTNSRSFKWYGCYICNEKRNMFVYRCLDCQFQIDIICALASFNIIPETYPTFNQYPHHHPLIFIETHHDELKRACCSWCQEPLEDSIYICIGCKFYLHKKCVNLPVEINNHPCHRKHPLTLSFDENYHYCKLCQQNNIGYFYSCSLCKFDIDIQCVWQNPIIEDKSCHEHPFTLFWRQDSFICNACGVKGNYVSYICSVCHLQVHKNCTTLPHTIKLTRHNHPLLHHYSLQQKQLEKRLCGLCLDEVEIEHGSYCCLQGDCKYIVHVNCVVENYVFYYIIDRLNPDEEPNASSSLLLDNSTSSSITRVIEKNELGEAIKIRHLFHEHDLILENKLNENDDIRCDGCMLSISTSFYYCSQCNFLVHKACAESSREKYNWFHLFSTTLTSYPVFRCSACLRLCSGFCYESSVMLFYLCLRCAAVTDTLNHHAHKHLLYFDLNFEGLCNACGGRVRSGAYRCKDCNFAVDFGCITLPHEARHKCDEHLLKLSYQEEIVDAEQNYCDICEEERNPNHWFYHCAACDSYAHPTCVFGKYSFIKVGATFTYEDIHPHALTTVQKTYDYPRCFKCGMPCRDSALECAECNYIVHWKCIDVIEN